jgi:hypothetical protein
MITFDREITVTVCANSASELAFWVQAFEDFFGACTLVKGEGVWVSEVIGKVSECNVQVSHLYEKQAIDFSHEALETLIAEYKCGAEQECVLVVIREVMGRLA